MFEMSENSFFSKSPNRIPKCRNFFFEMSEKYFFSLLKTAREKFWSTWEFVVKYFVWLCCTLLYLQLHINLSDLAQPSALTLPFWVPPLELCHVEILCNSYCNKFDNIPKQCNLPKNYIFEQRDPKNIYKNPLAWHLLHVGPI